MIVTIQIPTTALPAFEEARDLCRGAGHNSEYVRGCAELLIRSHRGMCMDDRDAVMEWLAVDDDVILRATVEAQPVDGFTPVYQSGDAFREVRALRLCVGAADVAVVDLDSARMLLPVFASWVAEGRLTR